MPYALNLLSYPFAQPFNTNVSGGTFNYYVTRWILRMMSTFLFQKGVYICWSIHSRKLHSPLTFFSRARSSAAECTRSNFGLRVAECSMILNVAVIQKNRFPHQHKSLPMMTRTQFRRHCGKRSPRRSEWYSWFCCTEL